MNQILVYGGSFNPPHYSHLFTVLYYIKQVEPERFILVPCYHHHFEKDLVPIAHRIKMLQLLITGLDFPLEVSDLEEKMGGVSYTIETLKRIQALYPGKKISLVIGEDNLARREQWKDFEEIERDYGLRVIGRQGVVLPASRETDYPVAVQLPAISSSLLREHAKNADYEALSQYTPRDIINYIKEHHLYEK